MFIENLIGSKAKVKLLRVLSEVRAAFTLKDLEAETGLSLSIVHKAAEELADEGIFIKIKGKRKQRLYKFNTDSPFSASIFDLFRIEKTRQRKEIIFLHTWSILEEIVSKIKHKSDLVILFGSQARGDATLRSDIDLFVMPKDSQEEILDALREAKSKNKINPLVISLEAFKSDMKNDTLLYRNIKSDSIILHIDPEIDKDIAKFLKDIQYKKEVI